MAQDPYIYVIDIDGTIIGDVSYEVAEWELLKMFDARKIAQFKAQLIEHLKSGLLRPHLADFVTQVKLSNENSEFFLYTASDDKWAQFLVPCIEAACGLKFARPIFSRKHCINVEKGIKKSLWKISNVVFSKVRGRYNSIKKVVQVYDNMILIDNNKVLVEKEVKKGLLCPTYEYIHPYDVLRLLDPRILHENAYNVMRILAKYEIIDAKIVNSKYTSFALLASYYDEYANALRNLAKMSRSDSDKDKFWLRLGNLIVALQHKRVSKEGLVKYANSKL